MAADQKVGLIAFDPAVFGGQRKSYAFRGMCSFCKKEAAVQMNANPARRKAYCDLCAKQFGH